MALRFATNSIARFSSVVSLGFGRVTAPVGSDVTGVLFNHGGVIGNSSTVFNATEGGYEFLYVGDTPIADSIARWPGGGPYPLFWANRQVNWAEINDATYNDFSELTAQSNAGVGNQYCAFNSRLLINDATGINWNHICGFEDLNSYGSTGNLTEAWSFLSAPTINGPAANRRGLYILNAGGSGTIDAQYGLYINALTRGTNNWGIYTAGLTNSYIGGKLLISTTEVAVPADPKVTISKNTGALPAAPSTASLLHLYNADGVSSLVTMDAFGSGANAGFVGRAARGTAAAPTNIQSGDFLFATNVFGYNSTGGFAGGSVLGQGLFGMSATEAFTSAGSGTRWEFWTNTTGALTITRKVAIGAGLMVNTTTDPGLGCILATGSILSNGATAGVGYATGAGGAVTQITSRTTGVTLNKVCGAITLFAAAPAVGTWVSFTVTNSAVVATDVPRVAVKSGTNTYIAHVTAVGAGSFQISFTSIVGTASDSPVINFDLGKAVAA